MKTVRPLLLTALALLLLTSMFSCTSSPSQSVQTPNGQFQFHEIILTLDDSFTEVDIQDEMRDTFLSAYGIGVVVMKESFESMQKVGVSDPQSISIDEYMSLFIRHNRYDATPEEIDGLTAFTYYTHKDDDDFKLLVCIFRTDTAFWSVQFIAPVESYDTYEDQFIDWANQITFTDENP